MIAILKFCIICATLLTQAYSASIDKNDKSKDSKINVGAHIVGGIDVTIATFPYQASLRSDGEHMCGASIIGCHWLLTAAHCTNDVEHSGLTVQVGSSDRTTGGTVLTVEKVIEHDQYNSVTFDYDIALVKITPRIVMSDSTARIKLIAANTEVAANTNATVSGWGHIQDGDTSMPTSLRAVSVPTIGQDQCSQLLGVGAVTERMLCAGDLSGGKDSCQYDSGGPLVAEIGGVKVQIGVVSHGDGCAQANKPGVYSSVPNLREWIKTNSGI